MLAEGRRLPSNHGDGFQMEAEISRLWPAAKFLSYLQAANRHALLSQKQGNTKRRGFGVVVVFTEEPHTAGARAEGKNQKKQTEAPRA